MQYNDNCVREQMTILFILEKMETPLSQDNIFSIYQISDEVNYILFVDALGQLIKNNYVKNIGDDIIPYIMITVKGSECLNSFFKRIPLSVRESLHNDIKDHRVIYRKKQDYTSSIANSKDDTFDVTLKIMDRNVRVIELKIKVQSQETASTVCNLWQDKASLIYECVYNNLLI